MAANSIPSFNSSKPQPYRKLYESSLKAAQAEAQAKGGVSDRTDIGSPSIIRSENDGVKTRVSLDSGTVVINQPDAPIVDDYLHSLVLNDTSQFHTSRAVRQSATMVIKPGPNGTLMVTEKAITHVPGPQGGEVARSTWTRNSQVSEQNISSRQFYATLGGRETKNW